MMPALFRIARPPVQGVVSPLPLPLLSIYLLIDFSSSPLSAKEGNKTQQNLITQHIAKERNPKPGFCSSVVVVPSR